MPADRDSLAVQGPETIDKMVLNVAIFDRVLSSLKGNKKSGTWRRILLRQSGCRIFSLSPEHLAGRHTLHLNFPTFAALKSFFFFWKKSENCGLLKYRSIYCTNEQRELCLVVISRDRRSAMSGSQPRAGIQKWIIIIIIIIVRYHCGGWSEEVNSRILISYMVYL